MTSEIVTSPSFARRVLGLIDATDLSDDATDEGAIALCDKGVGPWGHVAGVCVWPAQVAAVRNRLLASNDDEGDDGDRPRVVTVANFPDGEDDVNAVLASITISLEAGADEIDVVLPYRTFIAGDRATPAMVLEAVRRLVPTTHVLKVIVESGMLQVPTLIAEAARIAIDHGADFLKTSTGKTSVSATPEAVHILLEQAKAAGRPVGVKASGGIRTLDDAAIYIDLADQVFGPDHVTPNTFRLGASSLLDAALAALTD